jgi:integrase
MVDAGFAPKRRVEIALGTENYEEARAKFEPYLGDYLRRRWEFENGRRGDWLVTLKWGAQPTGTETVNVNGEKVYAVNQEKLVVLGEGGFRETVNLDYAITQAFDPAMFDRPREQPQPNQSKPTPVPSSVDPDRKIIEAWINDKAVSARIEADAWRTFDLFKSLVRGKRFSDCDDDDGRKLVAALRAQGLKTATVQKLVGYLRSPINRAMSKKKKYPDLIMNAFSGVVPPKVKGPNGKMMKDATKRLSLDEEDMALLRERLHTLRDEDQVLWRFLAATGARLGEAFQIVEEFREDGIRFVQVGTKTDGTYRKIPLPECVLLHLPSRITGPLFSKCSETAVATASKRLNRFLRQSGVTSRDPQTGKERKVLHSLRHRAKTRLRGAGCPLDVQLALLGHEDDSVAADYGHFPVFVLRPWIDKIGF